MRKEIKMVNLMDMEMPSKAPMGEEMPPEEMMEEEEEMVEDPFAAFSDEEIMDEVKKRGLV